MNPVVYFDLETGGLEVTHPIIQIGAVAVRGGQPIDRYEAKLQFLPGYCSPEALAKNGWDEEVWCREAKPALDVAREFAAWLSPYKCLPKVSKAGKAYKVAQLAGYNAAVFDAPRIQRLYQQLGIFLPADYKVLDVMQLVLWYCELYPNHGMDSHKLGNVCAHFGIPLDNAHDALADTLATAQLAELLKQKLGGLACIQQNQPLTNSALSGSGT
jgi:DNA polymerase-3 subunit epsilon